MQKHAAVVLFGVGTPLDLCGGLARDGLIRPDRKTTTSIIAQLCSGENLLHFPPPHSSGEHSVCKALYYRGLSYLWAVVVDIRTMLGNESIAPLRDGQIRQAGPGWGRSTNHSGGGGVL